MTINQFLAKCRKYWYILLIIPVLSTAVGLTSFATKVDYKASLGLGLSISNPNYAIQSGENYDRYLTTLSEFLVNRLKSIEVQKMITSEMGLPDSVIDAKKPIYEIVNQNSGFVSVSASFNQRSEAEKFLSVTKKAYQNIVNVEKNVNESSIYQIKPMSQFLESVIEVKAPLQLTLAPSILGLLVSILIVSYLPIQSTK
jgi:capsular polysaccharide biosynthesis protein